MDIVGVDEDASGFVDGDPVFGFGKNRGLRHRAQGVGVWGGGLFGDGGVVGDAVGFFDRRVRNGGFFVDEDALSFYGALNRPAREVGEVFFEEEVKAGAGFFGGDDPGIHGMMVSKIQQNGRV